MKSPHILIVDDEANVRFVLEHTLRHEGYTLDTAVHGAGALKKLSETSYDLLLLDLHMEPIGGLEVFNSAREQDPDMVVIILTAYSSVESAVEALRLGAFDYLFKPATPAAIRQRVKEGLHHRQQTLRRRRLLAQIESLRQALDELDDSDDLQAPPQADRRFIHSGELTIDCHHRQATLGDKLLDLTTAEFDLLLALVKAAPAPLTPRQLVNYALGYDSDETEARSVIKWHIHHLRRKIEPDLARPRYIKTVRHKGYVWSGT
jgi:DNA-binding response OmpR family regulator